LPASVNVRTRSAPFSSMRGAAAVELAWLGIAPPSSACAPALAHDMASAIAEVTRGVEKRELGMVVGLALWSVLALLRC
jgi:hypothetical protein